MRRFLPALLLSFALLAVAPFFRELRDLVFRLFPAAGVRLLAAVFALVLLALLVLAVRRIRDRRALRFGGLALVLVLLWAQATGFTRPDLAAAIAAQVNVAERFHIVAYGLLAILYYRAFAAAGGLAAAAAAILAAVLVGTADEGLQWLVPRRVGELRDVLMNATAGVTGTLFALCVWPPATWRLSAAQGARLLATAAAAVLALGLFVDRAHLGYRIDDPQAGAFRSWFNAAQLRALAADRARAWQVPAPPTNQEVLAFEDRYLSEAGMHEQHRNERFAAGAYVMAWRANRILERYYYPHLDKRGGRKRLTPRQIARMETAGAHRRDPAGYLSPVLAGRVVVYPKPRFRLLLAMAVAALLAAAWTLRRRARRIPRGRHA